MNKKVIQAAEERCRMLRRNSTVSENLFWDAVRNRKFLGKKFLRQHPLFFRLMNKDTFFIADFFCNEQRLVVEIDGKSHDYQADYDAMRTHIINDMGINVIRFKNEDTEKDLVKVLKRLEEALRRTHPVIPARPQCTTSVIR